MFIIELLPYILNVIIILYLMLVAWKSTLDKEYDKASCYWIMLLIVFEIITKIK